MVRTAGSRLKFAALLLCTMKLNAQIAAQPTSSAPAQATASIRSTTNLVVVDVVVTDSAHKPVHQLKASDFTVLENGRAQSVKAFEEHVAPAGNVKLAPLPPLPPNTFTNYSAVPANGVQQMAR
jgi:hypothetical protein